VDPHHFDADLDSTDHTDADPDFDFYLMWIRIPVPSFRIKAQTLDKSAQTGPFSLHFCLQTDADLVPIQPITLMRMWIRVQIHVTKMMRIHADPDPDADPDPQHWFGKYG
jgi:hypothetical protein